MQQQQSRIKVSAALMVKNAAENIATTSKNEHQWSFNGFWSCIMHTDSTVQRDQPMINVLAASIGKNAGDNDAATS